MDFCDRPKPSPAYVVLLSILLLVVLLFARTFPLLGERMADTLLIVAYAIPVLLLLELLHAAFATEYRIAEGVLFLRCGWMLRKRIPLAEIQAVSPLPTISRVLGWSPGEWGFCNRMRNGLALKTAKTWVFISPTDPEAFRAQLRLPAGGYAPPAPAIDQKALNFGVAFLIGNAGLLMALLSLPLIAGLVPPNHGYGFRTAATLANPEVWYRANRIGGGYLLVAGLAIIVGVGLLFRFEKRLHSAVFGLLCAAWTLLCTIGAFLLSAWHARV